jgi:hypothetical protein
VVRMGHYADGPRWMEVNKYLVKKASVALQNPEKKSVTI